MQALEIDLKYRMISLTILDQALAEPGGAEGKRVVSIHKNFVKQFEKL